MFLGVTTNQELLDRVAAQTVPAQFLRTVGESGDLVALRWKDGQADWREMTFNDLADQVARVAGGFRALGIGPGDRIVLMMVNRPEFHVIDLAATMVGATPVSIYNSSSVDQVQYLTGHSRAKLAMAGNSDQLRRFLEVRDQLPDLVHVGVIDDGDHLAEGGDVMGYASLLGNDPLDLGEAAKVAQPEDLATVIYTSGTTGPPKGVMITHQNVAWTVASLTDALEDELNIGELAGKRIVSYLPMAHIAERMISHYEAMFLGFEVSTCPDPTLIAAYAAEVRPNIIFGVPRVWEKIYAGVNAALAADPEKAEKFAEGLAAAAPLAEKMTWGTATSEEIELYEFLDAVAFSTVRELVGLDQVQAAVTGAAPIPREILAWFRTIGLPLSEIYGMSESSGPMTWAPAKVKPGLVGPVIPGAELRLAEDGEVLTRGGHVFAGYLDDPDQSAEVLDADGWLRSGDIGELDDDGYLRIVDRKKELIVTAGGKNLSPANLEAALKMIPLIGQACAIGDSRPFVSALVVLDPDAAAVWATAKGVPYSDLEELAIHPDVVNEVQSGLVEAMASFNNAEKVKKVKILGTEWPADSELLTPTAKLKRRGVHERFRQEIEELYSR